MVVCKLDMYLFAYGDIIIILLVLSTSSASQYCPWADEESETIARQPNAIILENVGATTKDVLLLFRESEQVY